ncbi:MAG: iron-containing alcohol dehydrogenase [Spirochaetales bacterium]|nr:iron-containing alcohol dehydrogenase [Spirochaetales bacterium]
MSSWEPDSDFVFHMPTKVLYGPGSHREIRAEMADLACDRAVIVTDRGLRENTDLPARIQKALGATCVGVFDDVEPDSRFEIVDAGAAFAAKLGADCLVSVGGGSSMDTTKAISIVMTNGGSIREHLAVHALTGPQTPHIAVPTTAGTGSEVTNVALIKDEAARTKFFVLDNQIFPRTAILDPTLTTGLPAGLTASTAMDAMTHAIEAITSICRNSMSESFAVQAIGMINGAIRRAVEAPEDILARGTLLSAATMAGAAFCNAMVGVVHAVAHALGGVCSVPHGIANSIMLPHAIHFNAVTDAEAYAPVVATLGIKASSPLAAAQMAAARLTELAASCGLQTKLSQVGVNRRQFQEIADKAMADGAVLNNCRPVAGPEEIVALLDAAF